MGRYLIGRGGRLGLSISIGFDLYLENLKCQQDIVVTENINYFSGVCDNNVFDGAILATLGNILCCR